MHISIVAYGTWGDVRPGIALGRALKEAGYEVRLIVTEDFARWVRDSELDIHLLPISEYHLMKRVSSQLRSLPEVLAPQRRVALALREAGQDLLTIAHETDVLIVNEWLLGIASGIAEAYHLRLINMVMQPLIKTGQMPICTMPALPDRMPFRESYNKLTYDAAYFAKWWSYVRIGNSLRLTSLNLPPLSSRGYRDLLMRTPSVTTISPRLVSRPADWADHHHLTGFLFYDDTNWQPPVALVDFVQSGSSPIYVGFGSLHDASPDATTCLILDALKLTGQRAVLYGGWAGLGRSELPGTVYRLDYAPHSWLFPRMAAVVHHAGAGTTAAALRAGVPSVTIPRSGDQPFWARRLYQIGGGTAPLVWKRLNAGDLARSITAAMTDSHLRNRAVELGHQISSEDGAGATVAAIDRILLKQ